MSQNATNKIPLCARDTQRTLGKKILVTVFVCSVVYRIDCSIAHSSVNKLNRTLGALSAFIDAKADHEARHVAALSAQLKNLGTSSNF